MATKPKAILSTHDGREASPITKASNVLFENGQTAQDILNDRQDAMISPVIENSSSMFKVGQGDNVDYSANVVNGAYESMVLKGKSMVNCIQEPSSQDVVLPYEFADGQYVTISDTKESGALGIELKGQTLVNLYPQSEFNAMYTSRVQVERGYRYTQTQHHDATRIEITSLKNGRFKTNTTYYVQLTTKVNKARLCEVRFENGQVSTITLSANETKVIKAKVSSGQTLQRFFIYFRPSDGSDYVGDTFDILDLVVLEHQDGMENWDIPYFEGMTSCKMPTLHTVGKNLFSREKVEFNKFYIIEGNLDVNNEGTFSEANGLRSLTLSLPQNENFTFSIGHPTGNLRIFASNEKPSIRVKGKKIFGTQGANVATFNTGDYKYFTIVYYSYNSDNTSGKTEEETIATIQIEQGTATTPYEPHKSSILSLPEEVELHKVGDIEDTLNCNTGEYVQRIREVVFNGSEYWTYSGDHVSNEEYVVYHAKITDPINSSNMGIANKLTYDKEAISTTTFTKECVYINSTYQVCYVRIKRERNGIIDYLTSNPLTVQYQLATPIVTKINLSSTLKSWNTTTHIYSEIPENTLYPILSHSNPSYPVILKPSTKYSIVANSYSNNHTNSAINFNLGGATTSTTVGNRVTTITTPSTLSNELLTMSGRGNKLNNMMVIEGDVVGDEPYFEGICDCKSPILSNVGKNLFSCSLMMGLWDKTQKKPILNDNYFCTTDLIRVHPNTRVKVSGTAFNPNASGNVIFYGKDKNYLGDDMQVWVLNKAKIPSNAYYMAFHFGVSNLYDIEGTVQIEVVDDVSSPTTAYEPYKSNILSCNGDKIELTEDMFEQGSIYFSSGNTFASMTQNVDSARIRTKNLLSLKPNISYSVSISNDYYFTLSKYNGEQRGHSETGWTQNVIITPTSDMKDFGVVIRKADNRAIATSEFNQSKFQIREVDKTIVLRSLPNRVCDTLNVETGEYVQRIGEVVLDGSSDERWIHGVAAQNTGKTMYFAIDNFDSLLLKNGSIISDKFNKGDTWSGDLECIDLLSTNAYNMRVRILKERLDEENVSGFKQWLQQNPITVQYELATPIVSTVDIQGFPYAYTNGHMQLSSGSIEQSLTPKVEYSVATNRNGQIRSNQKMVERHQKQLDQLQAIILANLVNSQYNQTLTTLKYELSRV